MQSNINKSQTFASITLALFISSQVLMVSSALLVPKPAQAFLGIGDLTVTVGDIPRYVEKVATGVMRELASRIADKFITRFVDKMVEKYKIRNFLYYDQVLTDYYLNNYIRDKIDDPDLQQIYYLLQAGYVTGDSTGLDQQPNPNAALIPRLKVAINKYYLSHGGIDTAFIQNPPANWTNSDYYNAASLWSMNPPSYTEQNLSAQFGAFQSAATTAAQLEIIVGNGLKAGRVVGGTCAGASVLQSSPLPGQTNTSASINPNSSPQACTYFGGTWQSSALDKARSFIDNPSLYIQSNLDGIIKTHIDSNFNPNNYWTVIGSLLGGFLWNQFALDKPDGALSDDPTAYVPENDNELDIDKDGIYDGSDYNGDGVLDVCYHGGTSPNCQPSSTASSSPYFITLCQSLETGIKQLQKYLDFVSRTQFESSASNTWLNRSTVANSSAEDLMSTLENYNMPEYDNAISTLAAYTKFMGKVIESLAKDSDLDFGLFSSDSEVRTNIINNTSNLLNYLTSFRTAINRCDNPNAAAGSQVPPPDINIGDNGDGGNGGGTPPADALTKHPDQTAVVAQAKAELVAAGVDLSNSCGAFMITNSAAWKLQADGAHILRKPSGARCDVNGQGYSIDVIVYPDGYAYDVIISSGAANTPAWQPIPMITDSSRYASPIDPSALSSMTLTSY